MSEGDLFVMKIIFRIISFLIHENMSSVNGSDGKISYLNFFLGETFIGVTLCGCYKHIITELHIYKCINNV